MPNILFVCTANLFRSPLAAAFFSKKLQEAGQSNGWIIQSAGTWTTPGQRLSPDLLNAGKNFGIDLANHVTQVVDRDLLARFDLIVVMEKGHKEALGIEFPFVQGKLRLLSEVVDRLAYDISDPGNPDEQTDMIADVIFKLIDRGYQSIYRLAQANLESGVCSRNLDDTG